MKRLSYGSKVAVLVLLAVVLTVGMAFASGQGESGGGGAAEGKITVALGDIESVEVMHLLIGLERLRERGIDVELVSYKSEDVANQAIVNGEADIGIGTPYSMIQNVNAPIRIFYQLSKVNFFPVVNTEYYDSWEDLDGEEMVVHSRTSATLALVQLMAQRYGIEYGEISYIPGSEVRATSMLRGNIRATIIDSYNKNFLLGEAPDRFKVLPVADVDASDEALFANLNFLEENPDVAKAFVVELLRTVRELNENPQMVLEYRERYNLLEDLPEELEGEILPFYQLAAEAGMFAEDGGGARAARSDFEFYGRGAGELQNPDDLVVEDYWYLEPIEAALAELDG